MCVGFGVWRVCCDFNSSVAITLSHQLQPCCHSVVSASFLDAIGSTRTGVCLGFGGLKCFLTMSSHISIILFNPIQFCCYSHTYCHSVVSTAFFDAIVSVRKGVCLGIGGWECSVILTQHIAVPISTPPTATTTTVSTIPFPHSFSIIYLLVLLL